MPTGEEYVCDICGYRTPRKSALTKHQKRKTPCDKAAMKNPDVREEPQSYADPAPTKIEEMMESAGTRGATAEPGCPDPEAYVAHLFGIKPKKRKKRKPKIPTHKRFAIGRRRTGRRAKQTGKYRGSSNTRKSFNVTMTKRASARQSAPPCMGATRADQKS
jgi:hypothetical protein